MADDRIRIEYMPLSKVLRWPRNPKGHSPDIGISIERFGFVNPIILDERSNRLIAGHGRIDALQAAKRAGKLPPARIAVQDDEWLVPVIRGIDFGNEREAEAFLICDNRLVELGGWDDRALTAMLADIAEGPQGFPGVGFCQADLDDLMDRITPDTFSDGGDGSEASAKSTAANSFAVVVECRSQIEQMKLLKRLRDEGYSAEKA